MTLSKIIYILIYTYKDRRIIITCTPTYVTHTHLLYILITMHANIWYTISPLAFQLQIAINCNYHCEYIYIYIYIHTLTHTLIHRFTWIYTRYVHYTYLTYTICVITINHHNIRSEKLDKSQQGLIITMKPNHISPTLNKLYSYQY